MGIDINSLNSLMFLNDGQFKTLKKDVFASDSRDEIKWVEIEAKDMIKTSQLLESIAIAIGCPYFKNGSWDSFLSFMRELSWIRNRKVIIVLKNIGNIMEYDHRGFKYLVFVLLHYILPTWEYGYSSNYIGEEGEDDDISKSVKVIIV